MSVRETWSALRSLPLVPVWLRGLELGSTPNREIFRRGNLRLLEYEPAIDSVPQATPIVVIPSMINRHYILDLLPGASFIEALCLAGFTVYSLEWLQPHPSDRYLTIDELFTRRIDKALAVVAGRSPSGTFHLVGQCLGGTLAIVESLLRPERVQTLTLMTTPVDFAQAGQLGAWAQAPLDVEALTDAYGNIPSSLLQNSFKWLRPSLSLNKITKIAKRWRDEDFMRALLALEMWSADNVDFPADCYRFLIEELYRGNKLSRGGLVVAGRSLDLEELRLPIFEAVAADDHIVPRTMRLPLLGSNPSIIRRDFKGGHLGAVIGGGARKTFWPELVAWLKSHESKRAS
ncbi:MAG: alpha/beta fold hydrolase [Bdellovibrionota bacterium]